MERGYITKEHSGGNPFGTLFILLLISAMVIGIVFAIQMSLSDYHGDKHGGEAERVDKCLENNGPIEVWKGLNSKWYQVCALEEGGHGIQVLARNAQEGVKKITNFLKTSGKNGKLDPLPRVEQYLAGPDPTNPLAEMAWDIAQGFKDLKFLPDLTQEEIQFIISLFPK